MAKKTFEEEQKQNTEIYTQFTSYESWLREQGIPEVIKRNIDMYEGNQWAESTDRTKNMPRPVFNAYAFLIETKLGNILGSPMHINYISDESRDISNKFTRISEYVRKEAEEDKFDNFITREAELKGTGFKYYYFDEKAIGKKGQYKGGVRIEIIDPLDIAFANPVEQDVQKQDWIIIRARVDVELAKSECNIEANRENIKADDIDNTTYTEVKELEHANTVYVYTKFKKVDNEVYFAKATKDVMIHDYKALNPKFHEKEILERIKKLEGEDVQETNEASQINHDSELEASPSTNGYKAYLYPINPLTFKYKNKRIIGIPDMDDVIEAAKNINANFGVATLNNLQVACPKYVVKENALQGQQISNKVGETIVDHTPQGVKGIDVLQAVPITAGALQLAPSSLELLRVLKGATDVITGETNTKDLSGYAIAQLSAQAQKPVAVMQKQLWRHKEREAEIFRQFIILFYNDDTDFKYKNSAFDMMKYEKEHDKGTPIPEYTKGTFKGKEFENFEFDVQVEVGAGTQYSEIQSMQQLDNLLGGGYIDFDTYINCYPDKAMAFKQEMKDSLRMREMSENVQLKKQIEALTQQLEQVSNYSKNLEDQNKEYKKVAADSQKMVENLTKEYTQKINYANQMLMQKDEDKTKKDNKAQQE